MNDAIATDEITREELRDVIWYFYARVRKHPRLGPIFNSRIGESDREWVPHLEKIERFWANVVRRERVYSGNPMQVHMAIAEIEVDDFAIWLGLFDEVAHEYLTPAKAEMISSAAHRIGRSLAMGVERARSSGPPNLSL